MILLVHMLFGAAIATEIQNPILAVVLAFLSHYFLDFLPHNEYSIKNITKRQWKKSLPDFLRVFLDFSVGVVLIFIFSQKTPIIFTAAFFAILPDGFNLLSQIVKNNFFELQRQFHQKKIHFLKYKKNPAFWRIASQVAVVAVSVLLLI